MLSNCSRYGRMKFARQSTRSASAPDRSVLLINQGEATRPFSLRIFRKSREFASFWRGDVIAKTENWCKLIPSQDLLVSIFAPWASFPARARYTPDAGLGGDGDG